MPQVSLYLDKDTMSLVEDRAHSEHLSVSKYVAEVLRTHAEESWPSDFWDLCGSVTDDTFVAPSRIPDAPDSPRESL